VDYNMAMQDVYNRSLFKNKDKSARNQLKKMGGIMGSSEQLMNAVSNMGAPSATVRKMTGQGSPGAVPYNPMAPRQMGTQPQMRTPNQAKMPPQMQRPPQMTMPQQGMPMQGMPQQGMPPQGMPMRMAAKGGMLGIANLADKGRFGDTELVHVNQQEKDMLQQMGGSGTINPATGLREYNPAIIAQLLKSGVKLTKSQLAKLGKAPSSTAAQNKGISSFQKVFGGKPSFNSPLGSYQTTGRGFTSPITPMRPFQGPQVPTGGLPTPPTPSRLSKFTPRDKLLSNLYAGAASKVPGSVKSFGSKLKGAVKGSPVSTIAGLGLGSMALSSLLGGEEAATEETTQPRPQGLTPQQREAERIKAMQYFAMAAESSPYARGMLYGLEKQEESRKVADKTFATVQAAVLAQQLELGVSFPEANEIAMAQAAAVAPLSRMAIGIDPQTFASAEAPYIREDE
tara:strand:+ start:376 stop:1737 length:1362 start_codon:yes stop_codon:yes gene_type:complete